MGVPYFQIKDTLDKAQAHVFSGNHRLYRDISKRVFAVLKEEMPAAEQYSIDEAFFTVTGDEQAVEVVAHRLKDKVEQLVGIPVSIGIAKSKTLAKVANASAKRGQGIKVLTDAAWQVEQQDFPLEQVWGIGAQLARRLRTHELYSVADYVNTDTARIRQLFGVIGERMQSELRGIPAIREQHKPKQSIMSSRSFAAETTDLKILKEAVSFHVEQIAYELRQMGHKPRLLAVYIAPSRHGDFVLHNRSAEVPLEVPTNSTKALTEQALVLLEQIFEADVPYKKAGVRVAALEPVALSQLRLFTSDTQTEHDLGDSLQEAIDLIHQKYQTGRLHFGRLERTAIYQGKAEKKSPAYTTHWNELKAVKAK
jgi:DNA polymerase V